MKPRQALHALETILDMLERLLPGFHSKVDRANLTEARAAIADVHHCLQHDLMVDSTLPKETPLDGAPVQA